MPLRRALRLTWADGQQRVQARLTGNVVSSIEDCASARGLLLPACGHTANMESVQSALPLRFRLDAFNVQFDPHLVAHHKPAAVQSLVPDHTEVFSI